MVLEPVLCPSCGSEDLVKHGQLQAGRQRYKCRNAECPHCTFIRDYRYRGYLPEVKQQITEMALNGNGIRDTARVLKINNFAASERSMKQPLFSASYILRDGESTLDEIEELNWVVLFKKG